MSKNFFFFITLISTIAVLTSCGKDPNDNNFGEWTIDGFDYQANRQGGIVLATDTAVLFGAASTNGSNLLLYFKSKPTASQTYEVVDLFNTPTSQLNSNQCYIIASSPTSPATTYFSTDAPENSVAITVAEGKLRADFNNIQFRFIRNLEIFETTGSGFVLER